LLGESFLPGETARSFVEGEWELANVYSVLPDVVPWTPVSGNFNAG
jgi:hypothetical protein